MGKHVEPSPYHPLIHLQQNPFEWSSQVALPWQVNWPKSQDLAEYGSNPRKNYLHLFFIMPNCLHVFFSFLLEFEVKLGSRIFSLLLKGPILNIHIPPISAFDHLSDKCWIKISFRSLEKKEHNLTTIWVNSYWCSFLTWSWPETGSRKCFPFPPAAGPDMIPTWALASTLFLSFPCPLINWIPFWGYLKIT